MTVGSGAREPHAGPEAGSDDATLTRLADEQAAVRRVSELVAHGAAPAEIFAAVAREVGELLVADVVHLARYEHDGVIVALAAWAREGQTIPVGTSAPYRGRNISAEVLRTGSPVRIDDYGVGVGVAAERVRSLGLRAGVGAPIVIDGRVWGLVVASSKSGPLPPGTEERIAAMTELAATALANAASQDQWRRLTHEPAALERVAALVARAVPVDELMSAVAAEIGGLLRADAVSVVSHQDGAEATPPAVWTANGGSPGGVAEPPRTPHSAACPVVVDGDVWGAITIHGKDPLPSDAGARLSSFADLMGLAVANVQARESLERVLAEHAALGRVATLIAGGAAPDDVFATVAREVGELLGADAAHLGRFDAGSVVSVGQFGRYPGVPIGSSFPLDGDSISARVVATGRPARMAGYDDALGVIAATVRELGIRSAIGVPIAIEGRPWGVMIVSSSSPDAFDDETAARLQKFTELVATAIANAATLARFEVLADEQARLRRVATLVAGGAPPARVFDAVAAELGLLLDVGSTGLVRFEDDEIASVVAAWGRLSEVAPVGVRLPLGGTNVVSQVARTGRPARVDDYDTASSGRIAHEAQRLRTRASVGAPVVVAGQVWGAMVAAALEGESLPPDTEARVQQFAELIGTAIGNADARVELARMAAEQAALRRVATLVAEEAPAADVLAKVAEEVAGVLGDAIDSAVLRFDGGDMATVVAVWGKQPAGGIRVDGRLPIDGSSVTAKVFRERRPVRIDDYDGEAAGTIAEHAQRHAIRAAVGCPIVVRGRLWGAMVVANQGEEPFASDTERRVQQFTDLVATAIANAEARAEQQRLAVQQAALRRVATLVAQAGTPTDVFDAVIVEVAQLLGAAQVGMMRYDSPEHATIVAQRGQDPTVVHVGMRIPLEGESVTTRVARTGRSARVNHYDEGSGTINELALRTGVAATVGAPITVEGRTWGVITASWEPGHFPPGDAEARVAEFAELIDTAIANADSRDQLETSRTRVLTAADEARRRVVRDLHDGAQQRLVHTIISLKLAERELRRDTEAAQRLLAEALDRAEQANVALRELVHGILPAVLTHGGLRAGVRSLLERLDVPVTADVTAERLAPAIEANAYFIVAEALTNVVKHARASRAEVVAAVEDGMLRVEVRDDGIGGADAGGHGLLGIADRAGALGGRLRVASAPGGGTVVTAELPLQ